MQRLSTQQLHLALRVTPKRTYPLRALSTTPRRLNTNIPPPPESPRPSSTNASAAQSSASAEASQNGNPELPKFSLDGLGVSKNMKVFLIVVLSIFGTMETWFYCKAIWRWWYGEQGLAVTEEEK